MKSRQRIFLDPLRQFLFHGALSYIAISSLTALPFGLFFSSPNLRSFRIQDFPQSALLSSQPLHFHSAADHHLYLSFSPSKQSLSPGAVSYIASQTNGCDTALVESKKQNATQIIFSFFSFQFLKFLLSLAE